MSSPYEAPMPQLIKGRTSQPTGLAPPKDIEEYKKHLAFLKKEYLKLKNEYERVTQVSKTQNDELSELRSHILTLQADTRLEHVCDELDLEKELSTMYFTFDPNRYKINKLYNCKVFTEEEELEFRQNEHELFEIEGEIDKWLQTYNGNRKSLK
jgi:hypothetical protein